MRGHNQDADQCGIKSKHISLPELKARGARERSSSGIVFCLFLGELDGLLINYIITKPKELVDPDALPVDCRQVAKVIGGGT